MNVAFHTAVHGMLTAQSQVSAAAKDIVNSAVTGEDIIQPAIAIMRADTVHKASAAVARTASDMTDTLLDITV